MDGAMVALWIAAFAVFSFWLCLYVYGLFQAGKWLASRWRLRLKPAAACAMFAIVALAADLPALPFQMESIYKLTLLFGLWLVHAQPIALGYWAGYDAGREADEERWASRVSEWLGEFEDRPPECFRDYRLEDPDG